MSAHRQSSAVGSIAVLIGLAIGAACLGWLFATGRETAVATERAELIAAIWRHVGYGAVLTPVLLAYSVWRVRLLVQRPAGGLAAALAGWAVVATTIFLVISGPIVVWTYGAPLRVFDWFVIANPIGELKAVHDPLEVAHVRVAQVQVWVVIADLALYYASRRRAPQP